MTTGATVLTKGATLSITPVSTPILIGQVNNIQGLSAPVQTIPTPSFADTFISSRPGRPNAGQFTFTVMLDQSDAGQTACLTCWQNGTTLPFKLTLATGTLKVFNFSGWISNMTYKANDDGIYMSDITVMVTVYPTRSSS